MLLLFIFCELHQFLWVLHNGVQRSALKNISVKNIWRALQGQINMHKYTHTTCIKKGYKLPNSTSRSVVCFHLLPALCITGSPPSSGELRDSRVHKIHSLSQNFQNHISRWNNNHQQSHCTIFLIQGSILLLYFKIVSAGYLYIM
jgi:hypothetical protein